VDPTKSSEQWRLSEKGKASCAPLADALREQAPAIIVSSEEPKASETAQLIAKQLNVPTETAPDLHEHDRSNVPHMRSGEFISHMELFFRRADERVLGRETADEALTRFESAVEAIVAKHATGNVAIVTHGTVLALFVADRAGKEGFQLWRQLQLPSFVVMTLPDYQIEATVDRIA
jgi:broad specificity phosphatase PhoE